MYWVTIMCASSLDKLTLNLKNRCFAIGYEPAMSCKPKLQTIIVLNVKLTLDIYRGYVVRAWRQMTGRGCHWSHPWAPRTTGVTNFEQIVSPDLPLAPTKESHLAHCLYCSFAACRVRTVEDCKNKARVLRRVGSGSWRPRSSWSRAHHRPLRVFRLKRKYTLLRE